MPRRKLTDEERMERARELKIKAGKLSTLTEHPAWATLRAEFETKRRKWFEVMVEAFIHRGEVPDLQRNSDFWRGAEWVLNNPDLAEKSLRIALDDAGIDYEEVEVG